MNPSSNSASSPKAPKRLLSRGVDILVWGAILYFGWKFFFAGSDLSVGDVPPEWRVGQWVNPPIESSLAELRGRVVYLEFWSST